MTILSEFVKGVKDRINLVNQDRSELNVRNLIEHLEGLDWFVEEEKKKQMRCLVCGQPLYEVRGRLTCVEMHH